MRTESKRWTGPTFIAKTPCFTREIDNEMRIEPFFHSFLDERASVSLAFALRTIRRLTRSYRANSKTFCCEVLTVSGNEELEGEGIFIDVDLRVKEFEPLDSLKKSRIQRAAIPLAIQQF